MTAETVMRRIAKLCRENISTYENYHLNRDHKGRAPRPFALGQAFGTVQMCEEVLVEIRKLRKELK